MSSLIAPPPFSQQRHVSESQNATNATPSGHAPLESTQSISMSSLRNESSQAMAKHASHILPPTSFPLPSTTATNEPSQLRRRSIRLHFAARDVPERGARTRLVHAVIFRLNESSHNRFQLRRQQNTNNNDTENNNNNNNSNNEDDALLHQASTISPREDCYPSDSDAVNRQNLISGVSGPYDEIDHLQPNIMSGVISHPNDQPQILPHFSAVTLESVGTTGEGENHHPNEEKGKGESQRHQTSTTQQHPDSPVNTSTDHNVSRRSTRFRRMWSRRSSHISRKNWAKEPTGPPPVTKQRSTVAANPTHEVRKSTAQGTTHDIPVSSASQKHVSMKDYVMQSLSVNLSDYDDDSKPGEEVVFKANHWKHALTTESCRKLGRDVEFSTPLNLDVDILDERPTLRVVLFDSGYSLERQRFLAFTDVNVRRVFAANGQLVSHKLYLLTITSKKEWKVSSHFGQLFVACDIMGRKSFRYRLDVECNRILRAKSLTTAFVKEAFYTIHVSLGKEEGKEKNNWVLLFRSETSQMIQMKRYGGSQQYNYFMSGRLEAGPGVIQMSEADEDGGANDIEHSHDAKHRTSIMKAFREKVGPHASERLFFSLPTADLVLSKRNRPLKLSVFEDHGTGKGYEFIAGSYLSMHTLKHMRIGDSIAIKTHNNVVGHAELKLRECNTDDPRYFCLTLVMQNTVA